jgi:hypothetical protein
MKKPYQKPKLTTHGEVEKITQCEWFWKLLGFHVKHTCGKWGNAS